MFTYIHWIIVVCVNMDWTIELTRVSFAHGVDLIPARANSVPVQQRCSDSSLINRNPKRGRVLFRANMWPAQLLVVDPAAVKIWHGPEGHEHGPWPWVDGDDEHEVHLPECLADGLLVFVCSGCISQAMLVLCIFFLTPRCRAARRFTTPRTRNCGCNLLFLSFFSFSSLFV